MQTKKPHAFLWTLLISAASIALIINLLWPDSSFSSSENRPLSSFPSFSGTAAYNGNYGKDLERYAADQLVGRDFFFHLNYVLRKLGGQKEINGTYLGDGALFIKQSTAKGDVLEQNAKTLSVFATTFDIPVSLMIIPDAGQIQSEKLPSFAPAYSENEIIDQIYSMLQNVQTVDIRALLERYKDEYIYYRTDHHWTSNMAGLASGMVVEGFGSFQLSNYQSYLVSDSFQGGLASRTGSIFLDDDIYIYVDKNNPEYVVTWADGSKTGSIYQQSALEQKDQYELFLGPNQSMINIETMADSQRSLLILKDSYANSMIQFLLPYYKHITIIDPRYFYDDLSYVITSQQINEILVEQWYDTFTQDSSLSNVLESVGLDMNLYQDPNENQQEDFIE